MTGHSLNINVRRREFALLVDTGGTIAWADPAARRLLGIKPGASLVASALRGTEHRVTELLKRAAGENVSNCELVLRINGAPTTLTVSGGPEGDAIALVASLIPSEYADALRQVSDSMHELAELHRETERQQRELLQRNEELSRLNSDLDDSARGVMALHGEVEEKSDSLRRMSEVKSRVVANVSHEFRTPLNAIIGLSKMLISKIDGELTPEQEKQVGFILRSAESLVDLVNDLLDLSKIEAGKVGLRPVRFRAADLFAALRGMFRPLQTSGSVSLTFEAAPEVGELNTDEGKISQILKNLISNALKFTERGTVHVAAAAGPNGSVTFSVTDTGIGIAIEDQERIFEEFAQIDNALQGRTKGTGLGLSLSRRLAEILGGTLTVTSAPGSGSTFTLVVPRVHPEVEEMADLTARNATPDPGRPQILVVEDDRQTLFLYEKYLRGSGYQIVPARTIEEARAAMATCRPAAIVLDVMLEGETSWGLLSELKSQADTCDIPILVVTVTNREHKARALGADEFVIKPLDQDWLRKKLAALARRGPISRILVIDDDEVARYMVSKLLSDTPYEIIEASDGQEGVRLAREREPQVIFLDFVLPGMTAFDVLDELKLDATTRNIPVIIHTSRHLGEDERERLTADAAAILPKQNLSREVALGRIREVLAKTGFGPAAEEQSHRA